MLLNEQLGVAESTNLSETIVSDTSERIGLVSDASSLINPYFDDLISNDFHYHQIVSASEEHILDDDSNYSSIPKLVDIVDHIIDNPQKYINGGIILALVPSNAIYTQDAKLGNAKGSDRLWKFESNSNHKKRYDEYSAKGWKQAGSDPLTGYVRWIRDPFGNIIGICVSKICGNGRHYMKKRVHGGEVVDLPMMINFHPTTSDVTMDYSYYQTTEVVAFRQDQQDQLQHDASTKFLAGVKSNDPQWVKLRDLFKKYDIDYDQVVEKTTDIIPKWNLSSFEGFSYGKAGKPGREIREYDEENFKWALKTLTEIQNQRVSIKVSEHTSGLKKLPFNEIPNSALRVLLRMFSYLTEGFTDVDYGDQTYLPFMTKKELKRILVWRYTQLNSKQDRLLNGISELNMKSTEKDFYFLGIKSCLPDILDEMDSDRTNRVKSKNPAVRRYIDKIREPWNREAARNMIDRRC